MNVVRKLRNQPLGMSFALLLLTIISFGLMLPQLGFYWDDWAKTLVHRVWGLDGYWAYYAEDRPISGWTHIFWISLIGDIPLAWHLLNLVLRWLTAWGMWWTLSLLWPESRQPVALSTFLFVVYPIFDQQFIPVTFHQQWMQYALIFLSFGLMIRAVGTRSNYWIFTGAAIIPAIIQLTITEYFIGVELVRPFLLWALFRRTSTGWIKIIKVIFRHWLPYLVLTALYVVYRLFFIQLTGEDPYRANTLYNLMSQPLATLIDLVKVVGVDTLQVLIAHWANQISLGLAEPKFGLTVASWLVGLAAAIWTGFHLWKLGDTNRNPGETDRNWILEALVIGLAGTLLGCLPAWATGRQILFDSHSNRYAQAAMFGASLVWVAGLEWLIQKWHQKVVFVAVLVALAAGFHYRTANTYAESWSRQTRFYWHLAWRAPYITPGTAIISEDTVIPGLDTFSFSSAINAMYPQPTGAENLSYWTYTLKPRYANRVPEPLEIRFKTQFRTLTFSGKTPDSLLIYLSPGMSSCLWVIEPNDRFNPDLPDLYKKYLPISSPGRIEARILPENYPPRDILGVEPTRDWCYYFEKADLARQQSNWKLVAELGDEAQAMGFRVENIRSSLIEWRPFIEGYSRLGRWDDARDLIFRIMAIDTKYDIPFCQMWRRILAATEDSPKRQLTTTAIWEECNCTGRGE